MSEVALTLRKIFHRGSYRKGLFPAHHPAVNARLKTLGASYSATQKCWHVDYTAAKYKLIKLSFAHLPGAGTDIRNVQQLPGHKDIRTTMINSHPGQPMVDRVKSPLDRLNLKANPKIEAKKPQKSVSSSI